QLLRYRQFWQWGLECYGAAEPGADLEQIEFTAALLAEVGLTEYTLKVNTVGETAAQPKIREALKEYFERYRAERDDDCNARLDSNVLRIVDCKKPSDRKSAQGAPKLRELVSDADKTHFAAVVDGLDRLGVAYEVDERLARGFDYYTRTVFECHLTNPAFTKAGEIAVAGGGRYDGLVRTMGGPDTAGVGIAGGVDVLYYALKEQGVAVAEEPRADVYVLSAQSDDGADRLQLAGPLREAGFSVAIDYSTRSLERQLESAVKHGAKVAVIRGTPEARGGNVIVRDLAKKVQRVTRLAAVVVEVGRHVPKRPKPRLESGPNPDEHEPGAAGEGPYLGDGEKEWVLRVRGTVRARPEGTKNPRLATGEVEVVATEVTVLNASKTPPFYVNEETEVDENLRWKYRYVDLRRERSKDLMRLRHEVVAYIRRHLIERGFWEIETPTLIRSDPTGARDFIVPSRYYPGRFWALPQSPQQYKQILMVGGLDKYFQIAHCYRDEDPRADRVYEHTQLDLEMSFVDREDVMATLEGLYTEIFRMFARKPLAKTPVPRMTYEEAIRRFGIDRPDLRFAIEL